MTMNVATLKDILKDDRLWIGIGLIKNLHLAKDFSYLKVTLSVLPEEREIIANMTWESVGPESGDYDFPSVNDLVLFAQSEGDDDSAYVIKRMSSQEDKIPEAARTGDKVHKAKAGKKYWNISDTNIYLSKSDTAPIENLVLGQIFKKFAADLLDNLIAHVTIDSTHTHTGNLGFMTGPPTQTADYILKKVKYTELKADPIQNEKVLSDLAFTEK